MDGFPVLKKHDPKKTFLCLGNLLPSSDSSVSLDMLDIRLTDNAFDPFHRDTLAIRSLTRVEEVLRTPHYQASPWRSNCKQTLVILEPFSA